MTRWMLLLLKLLKKLTKKNNWWDFKKQSYYREKFCYLILGENGINHELIKSTIV